MTLFVILIILAILVIAVISIYNKLVRLRNTVKSSWSDIDVQMKKRFDLVPNLVETVKGYAAHEKTVFEKVTQARSMAMQATSRRDGKGREHAERHLEKPVCSGRGLSRVKSQYEFPPAPVPTPGLGEHHRICKKILQCRGSGLQHPDRVFSLQPHCVTIQFQARGILPARSPGGREKTRKVSFS